MELPAFLRQKPPSGYIAGIGRGATGFTTRSDIGSGKTPERIRDDREKPLNADGTEEADEDRVKSNAKVRFEDSNGLSLVSNRPEGDDEEADRIYKEIDAQLGRRNAPRKKVGIENANNSIQDTFAAVSDTFVDLKRSLATVSDEQWSNLPEAGDITKRNKRQRLELQSERKSYAAPDALISGNIDLTKLTQEREKLLGRQLDESLSSKGNKSEHLVSSSENYLHELDASAKAAEVDQQVQDVERMRTILNSYRRSDPKKPQGWIASARLEEQAKKFRLARSLIEEGCNECPRDKDIWLENIRLNAADLHYCKILVAKALTFSDRSLDLWLKAIELEKENFNKLRVVRKAIRSLPTSEELWKLAVQYENDRDEAIKILQKATELMPHSLDLLTALINLQDRLEARKTLNLARQNNPSEVQIWVLACELEERCSDASVDKLAKLFTKGLQELAKHGRSLTIDQWLQEAAQIEQQFPDTYQKTLQAMVKVIISFLYNPQGYSHTIAAIDNISQQCTATRCHAYKYVLEKDPSKFGLWKKLVSFCQTAGRMSEAYQTFETVLFGNDGEVLVKSPVLALMYSKLVWKSKNNIEKAMKILDVSLTFHSSNIDFWLAKLKILTMDSQFEKAEELFNAAVGQLASQPGYERICHRFVGFLRFRNRTQEALELLETKFLSQVPLCEKLYLQRGQMYCDLGQPEKARECYFEGVKILPNSASLWIALGRADKDLLNLPVRARSDLDLALLKVPAGAQQESLLVARIQMEQELNNLQQASLYLAQALKSHPSSAPLWVEKLKLTSKKSLKKTAYQDALKSTNSDYRVLVAIGIDLFSDSHYEKALKWFQRATAAAPRFGDGWIWVSRCLERLGRNLKDVVSHVDDHEPRYGPEWIAAAKDVRNLCLTPSQVLAVCLKPQA
ncbi:LANO_0A03334g1_1 [Lachancea nothofagi CBS 11611]|uniref:mRNA 3'-end-processing protein RNA14 n=1 Tax=Lachancea nothofagi CBS 11611 TaxID=1266666 RepID=A0A1G4IQ14_9SACH|nr:LANO_0A03334g1_1 [Lachancea nothofagi CBS 11611]